MLFSPIDENEACVFLGGGISIRPRPVYRGPARETDLSRNRMQNPPLPFSPPGDDERLLLKVAEGNRPAFATLYERLSMPLYSLALKILANETEAQDLLQEVFLSVWNKAATYRVERGSAFSWIVTQVRNRAIDRIRSRRRRGELLEENAPDLEPSGSVVPSSSENYEKSDRARHVRSALAQLSEEQREVLRLAYFEGLTQVEIAEKLEEPLGTIKARASRGMARLREALRYLHD
jgi:RNA polymerase sigma-70 factor (ECF subfamily)